MSFAASPNTPTARAMFFTLCSPRSAKPSDSLSRTCSLAEREMHTPPGSHNASSRAATFTPSPKMSPPSKNDVTDIEADAQDDLPVRVYPRVECQHGALNRHCTAHSIHDADEFYQQPVACRFEDPAVVAGDGGVDALAPMLLQRV